MADRPAFGTAPIRCGRTRCKWRGYETQLNDVPDKDYPKTMRRKTCPTCGCDSYMFMTEREIAAWKRGQPAQGGGA